MLGLIKPPLIRNMNIYSQSIEWSKHKDYDSAVSNKIVADLYVEDVLDTIRLDAIYCREPLYYFFDTNVDDKIVVVYDCDSFNELLSVTRYLTIAKIGYAVIRSSNVNDNDHYWIVADVAIDIDNAINMLKHTPGQDVRHANFAEKEKRIAIRAIPKFTFHHYHYPEFPIDGHNLKCKYAIRWYDGFKSYWDDWRIRSLGEMQVLRIAYAEGKIGEMVADPNFKLRI